MAVEFPVEFVDAAHYFIELALVLIPLFVVGAFLVGLIQEYLPPERVERILRRYDGGSGNVAAAGVGAITPFCACSTVPILAGLLGAGSPLGTSFSFLLASPLVNVLVIILLLGIFGIEVTALFVVLTLLAAIWGGILVGRLGLEQHVKETQLFGPPDRTPVADGGDSSGCCGSGVSSRPGSACSTDGCDDSPSSWSVGHGQPAGRLDPHRERLGRAVADSKAFFVDLLPYLVLGMAVGAVIHGFVPTWVLHLVIGPENPFAVLLAAVIGAPIYVSMSAMLPIAAALVDQGIPIGTVIAFVIGGAGVSIPNLIILNKLFDRTLLAVYAGTVVATGIVIGSLFNVLMV